MRMLPMMMLIAALGYLLGDTFTEPEFRFMDGGKPIYERYIDISFIHSDPYKTYLLRFNVQSVCI